MRTSSRCSVRLLARNHVWWTGWDWELVMNGNDGETALVDTWFWHFGYLASRDTLATGPASK